MEVRRGQSWCPGARGLGSKLVMTCRHARTPQLPAASPPDQRSSELCCRHQEHNLKSVEWSSLPLAGTSSSGGADSESSNSQRAAHNRVHKVTRDRPPVPGRTAKQVEAQAQSLCRDGQATSAGGAGRVSPGFFPFPHLQDCALCPKPRRTPPNLASRFPVGGSDLLASSPSWRQQGPQPCPRVRAGSEGSCRCLGALARAHLPPQPPPSTAQCPSASPRGRGPPPLLPGPDPYCCSSPTWTFGALRAGSSLTGDVLGGPWTLQTGVPLPGSPPLRASPEHPLRRAGREWPEA